MDDPRWLRLMTIGLVLAALAVGYFLFTGRLSSNSKTATQVSKAVSSPTPIASSTPSVLGQNNQVNRIPAYSPTPSPASAYNRIASRNQNNAQTLPDTGFPVEAAVLFSVSALVSGWGLRRFPH